METFGSISAAMNECTNEVVKIDNLIGIQANHLRKFEVEECREVMREWIDREISDPAILRSPLIGLNVASVIRKKRDRAAKEEAAEQKRMTTAKAKAEFSALDGNARAVVAEMSPLHAEYKAGNLSGADYSEALRTAYTRHGFSEPDKLAYNY